MRILECSSKGDRRFSAFYAKISFYGKIDSIEHIYQSVKRDKNGDLVNKGKKVFYVVINEIKLEPKYLTPFYKLLWVKYLDNNPSLVSYAKQFDDYNDMFKGKSVNCQADVIRQYIKQGRDSIMNEILVKELIDILSNN